MYKLCYHVPETHLEATKQALFDAGAGKVGNYDQCCWQVKGAGQYRPLPGSQPFLGQSGALEHTEEYLVEMVCTEAHITAAVAALRQSHPYEEPALQVLRMVDVDLQS
jgi:hypothetical protein